MSVVTDGDWDQSSQGGFLFARSDLEPNEQYCRQRCILLNRRPPFLAVW
jgi:hypothetical protein